MNSEEIESLKVTELRKELKNRGLPTSGSKVELVQRLMDYLSSEEKKLLQTNGSEIDDNEDVLDLPEEDVLGISITEDLSTPKTTITLKKPTVSITTTNPTVLPKKLSTEKLPEPKSVESEASPSVETVTANEKTKHTKITFGSDNAPSETLKKLERAKRFHTPLTDDVRKELRTEKFSSAQGNLTTFIKPLISGVKTTSASPASQDVLKRRAERFGLTNQNNVATTVSVKPSAVDSTKLAQRAERFGLQKKAEASANVQIKAIAIDTPDSEKMDSVDKISIRKRRFGDVSGGDQTSAKKWLRAEKFGLKK